MKKFKKIASLLLALVMVCAMSVTAFAATSTTDAGSGSITIDNAVSGQTYTIYQLATVTYNTETGAYTYTPTSDWSVFFATDAAKAYVTVTSQGYLTWTGDSTDEAYAAFAQLAQTYAATNNISNQGTSTASGTTVAFNNLSLGWYLVDTSLGALCDLTTTVPNVTIKEKNGTPSAEKVMKDGENKVESNTASVGDIVYYQTTVSNIAGASSLKLHDTMGSGLTLNTSSIVVTYHSSTSDTTGTVLTVGTNYTITSTEQSFTIDFANYADTLISADSTAYIVVEYNATVNSSATIGKTDGNENETYVTYGDGTTSSEKDTTTTYVYSFSINKTDNDSNSLRSAEFTLTDSNNTTLKFSLSNTTYTLDNTNGSTTITAGNVTISGLAAGTYTLEETKAPDGYNLLTYKITVVIDENGNVSFKNATTGEKLAADGSNASLLNVVNVAGSELPSTGGIGTTIFYVVGTIMVLGAVVVLITRKRMSAQ